MATHGFKMQSKKYKPYICYSGGYNVINESFDPTYDFGCGYSYTKKSKKLLKNLYLHQLRRNFSLVARCSLKFTRCLLLVAKSLVTRCKFARYLLQKLLVAKNHSLLVSEVAHCRKSLVTRWKFRSLLVAEVTRCKKSLVTCCKFHSLLVAKVARCKNHSLLIANFACCSSQKLLVAKFARSSLQLLIETTQIK